MAKLFLGNIPNAFTQEQIANWVESFGFPVESVEIIRDRMTGNPRGFGFVSLRGDTQSDQAIKQMNGQRMGGRAITVNEATPLVNTVNRSRSGHIVSDR